MSTNISASGAVSVPSKHKWAACVFVVYKQALVDPEKTIGVKVDRL